MKTIIEINGSNYGSTGNIALNIALKARENNFNTYTFVLKSKESLKHKNPNQVFYGNWIERVISERLSIITGIRDSFNILGTIDLINKIKKINPDLIHLHVIHDDFINIGLFFKYLKKLNIPIIWTFHDCWSITGHCPYFDIVGCQKWKIECHDCPQWSEGPKSLFFDTSKIMFKRKLKSFSNINNLTIITPSEWLESITKESMFKGYEIRTIYNGIDLSRFKYINANYKDKLDIKDKYLILGVANYWIYRKGIDVMIKLSKILPSNYQIVLVGTNDEIDKILPDNIISIHRTYNQDELVQIYSSADVFANPTREEVFGLVNVEALACGTPVVVFNTGGCPEIIDETCGKIIEKNDVEKMKNAIIDICENKTITKENCFVKSKQFDKEMSFERYIELYKEKLNVK